MNAWFAIGSLAGPYYRHSSKVNGHAHKKKALMFRVTLSAKALLTALFLSMFAVTPGGAADPASPVGKWQTTTGESRYEVSTCGDNSLCARLTWLSADARTPENLAHLNTYVVKGARQIGANRWSGTLNYNGEKIGGSMTMIDGDSMRLSGCKLIMCQTLEFERL